MIEELLEKRTIIEQQFNTKIAARDDHNSQAASLVEEMNQLKGAYDVLTELINGAKEVPKMSKKEKKL